MRYKEKIEKRLLSKKLIAHLIHYLLIIIRKLKDLKLILQKL